MSDKFPFALLENSVLVQNVFNSSFSCKYHASYKYEIGRPELVFKGIINYNYRERSYGNIIDNNDAKLNKFVLQLNFKYYNNY